MPFERYERYNPLPNEQPQLSIYSGGSGRFNKAARLEWFDVPGRVAIYFDRDEQLLGFAPPDDEGHTLAITESGDVYIERPLQHVGVDIDELGGTRYVDLEEDETGMVVADVSALVDSAQDPQGAQDAQDAQEARDEPADDVDGNGLLDPDDVHDLQRAYEEADSIAEAAERFPLAYKTIYQRLVDAGIHVPGNGGGPESVDSFDDLSTPEWLDEGSWYQGVSMADDVDELVEVLGWDDREEVARAVQQLGLEEEVVVDG